MRQCLGGCTGRADHQTRRQCAGSKRHSHARASSQAELKEVQCHQSPLRFLDVLLERARSAL